MKKDSIFSYLLVLAILIGIIVRTWNITMLPFPPTGDELAFGYYGWSLLHYGMDEYGNKLPLNFPSIGDYKYPTVAYFNILPAALFGLTDITTRFWSVISGILFIPLIYFLVLFLFENKIISIASSFIIALSPWAITESRLGFENQLAMTLMLTGLLSLLKIKNFPKKKKLLFISSLIFLLLSTFCYAAERVFIPILLIAILFLSFLKNSKFSVIKKPTLSILVILCVVTFISLIPWQNRGRAQQDIWKGLNPKEENRLQELYIESRISPTKIPSLVTHIFHNPIRITIEDFLYRYSNYYSPKFLFFEGEAATVRITDMGVLPLILIFFLPLGLITILTNKDKRPSILMVIWLLIAPLPAALTQGEPHMSRSFIMTPAITIISAFGFWQLLSLFPKKRRIAISVFISLLFLFNSLYALNQMFVQKPVSKPWVSEQVNKKLVKEILKVKNNYQAIAIPKDEYIFFLFYGQIPPTDFLKRSTIKQATRNSSWDRVERLDNIYFNMAYDCPKGGKLNVLYICSGPNIPQNSNVLKIIRYLDNVPAYTFIEFYPISKMPNVLPALPEGLKYMVDIEKDPKSPDGIIPQSDLRLW